MIKITTDSTCDLPERLLEQYGITVFPLGIVKAGKLYHDGVDIRTADIASHVEAGGDITTTNAVNVANDEDTCRTLTERYDAVIHINIGSGFSCCHQNAKLAAEEVPETALAAGLSSSQVGLITEENQGYILKSKLVEFWRTLEATLE